MNSTTRIIVTCGGTAGDIRTELGSRCKGVRKVLPREPVGNYGDFIFEVFETDAVFLKLKYPKVVRMI